jgi:AmmeMemoRadiSam system protein B
MYSGTTAGAVFSKIEIPRQCIVLGPNHTGRGRPLSIMSRGRWQTPLGDVSIDFVLAEELKRRLPALEEDSEAHRAEHAIEVELPFLLARQPDLTLTPIAIGTGNFEMLAGLGEAIAAMIAFRKETVLIVASSDMNHYEDDTTTRRKDALAIEQILAMDPAGLFDVVRREHISMCGFGPTTTMLIAANQLGAKEAELVQYATSGDAFGERERVVGYAGIAIW